MTRSEIRAEERRWRQGDVLVAVAAILIGATFAWIMLSVQGLRHDLVVANEARDSLARQVQSLGEKPVAGPPGSRGEPGKSVVGPSGPPGPEGPPGPSGKPGKTGKDGANGDDGTNGADGASATGSPGAQGAEGPAGPAGPAGPQGDPGPAGADGSDGQDGKDGTDGQDGQTCPDGYSLQTPSYDPDAMVCRKDSAPDPEPSETPTPQAAGLDPQRRMYI